MKEIFQYKIDQKLNFLDKWLKMIVFGPLWVIFGPVYEQHHSLPCTTWYFCYRTSPRLSYIHLLPGQEKEEQEEEAGSLQTSCQKFKNKTTDRQSNWGFGGPNFTTTFCLRELYYKISTVSGDWVTRGPPSGIKIKLYHIKIKCLFTNYIDIYKLKEYISFWPNMVQFVRKSTPKR